MLFTQKVLAVVKKGSSRPVIAIDSEGNNVFIKLNGGLSSPTAAISDWIARSIAIEIDLPALIPQIIIVDERADMSSVDVEVRDLLQKSYGFNSCSEYFPNVQDVDFESVSGASSLYERLFIFDLFLLNVDRTHSNSNLIHVANKEHAIDYEASMLIMGACYDTSYFQSESVLKALRQNPFYHPGISLDRIMEELEIVRKVDMDRILDSLPGSWLEAFGNSTESTKNKIIKSLTKHLDNKEQYIQLFERLKTIEFVTDAERKRKNLENRTLFTSKYSL